MNGLMLHCGASLATKDEVFSVPLPEPTESYFPLAYESLVTRIEKQLAVEGIVIRQEEFALSKHGQRMFGLMELKMPNTPIQEFGCVLGLRNSYDKSCSTGLCIGATVFVCDNLSFHGSAVTFNRKHTVNLMRDLSWVITEIIAKLPLQFAAQAKTFDAYTEKKLSDMQAHDLAIRFYDAGALNISDIPKLLHEWREPKHQEFTTHGKTAWRLFNAATETVKGDLWRLPMRTQAIHMILDAECGLLAKTETALPPQEPQEAAIAV